MENIIQKFFIFVLVLVAICSPILTVFALVDGAKVSFALIVITLIELVILLIVFKDKLLVRITTTKNQDRKKRIQKVANVVIILVAVCLLPGAWSISEEGEKSYTRDYSYNSGYEGNHSSFSSNIGNERKESGYGNYQQTKKQCQYQDCERILVDETDSYCYYHVCKKMGCKSVRYNGTEYCKIHTDEEKKQSTYNSNKSSSRKKKKYEDEYGVNDYSGADDFYEDNYDDFEGYEDAEDYYDEYAD